MDTLHKRKKWVVPGREDTYRFVNSAQGISRDRVEEHFPEATAKGQVPLDLIAREAGIEGDMIADLIIAGRVEIRHRVENVLGCKRMQAGKVIKRMDFLKNVRGIPLTLTNSLDSFLEDYAEQAREAHREAAAKRWAKEELIEVD